MTDEDILDLLDRATRQHSAFLGKTGSGKTSTAKLAIEQIVRKQPRARVCILDPIKSDWWGITSSADGKSPGLPFSIIGGPRAHVPLNPDAGKVLGKLVGNGSLRHTIIDMAGFGPGDLQRFYNAFAQALLSNMRGVLYLVLEEAHEFAPKEFSGIGDEARAVYHSKKIATAGRSKGIRLMVLTQRTQSLHNALLGSCESMFAHRLMAPADQAPVLKWLKANVDKERFSTIEAGLSRLANGTAWVVSGEAQILQEVTFPRITTYDNTRTPEADDEGDDEDRDPVMTAVDREHLAKVIGLAAEEIASDDPEALHAEIGRLKLELSRKPAAVPVGRRRAPVAPPQDFQPVFAAGFLAGAERVYEFAWAGGFKQGREFGYRLASHFQMLRIVERMHDAAISHDDRAAIYPAVERMKSIELEEPPMPTFADAPDHLKAAPNYRRAVTAYTTMPADAGVKVATSPVAPTVEHIKREGYSAPKRKVSASASPMERMLAATAELMALGIDPPTREIVAAMSNYSHIQSRPIRDAFGQALASGLIEAPKPGTVRLTDAGFAATAPVSKPMTRDELHTRILTVLDGASQKALGVLINAYPEALTREHIAHAANYTNIQSRPIRDAFSKLQSMGLARAPGPGQLAATEVLFP